MIPEVDSPTPKPVSIEGFKDFLKSKGFDDSAIQKKMSELGGQLNGVTKTTDYSSLSTAPVSNKKLEVLKPNEAFKSLAMGVINQVPTIAQGIIDLPMLASDLIAPDAEISKTIRGFTEEANKWLDATKFDIPSSNNKGFFEWSDDGFKINSFSDMAGNIGQGVGSLLSIFIPAKILQIPSIASKLGAAGVSMSTAQKASSFISGTLGMIEPVYTQATAAGLDPRDRAGVTLLTAPLISLMDTAFGVESMIIGKGAGAAGKKTITNLAGKHLDDAIESTLKKGLDGDSFQKEVAKQFVSRYSSALSKLKSMATGGLSEGLDEATQEFVEKGIQYGYDSKFGRENSRYDVDLFSRESVKDYINSAFIGGILGSGMGAFMQSAPKELEQTLFGYIQSGIEKNDDSKLQIVREKVNRMMSLDPENELLKSMVSRLSGMEYVASETANNNLIGKEGRYQLYSIEYNELPLVSGEISELSEKSERLQAINQIDTVTFENAESNADVAAEIQRISETGRVVSIPIIVGSLKNKLQNDVSGFEEKMKKLAVKKGFLESSKSQIKSTGKTVNISKVFSLLDKYNVGDEVSYEGNESSEKFAINDIVLDGGMVNVELSNKEILPITSIRDWTKKPIEAQEEIQTLEEEADNELINKPVILNDGLNTFEGNLIQNEDGGYDLVQGNGDVIYLGENIGDLDITENYQAPSIPESMGVSNEDSVESFPYLDQERWDSSIAFEGQDLYQQNSSPISYNEDSNYGYVNEKAPSVPEEMNYDSNNSMSKINESFTYSDEAYEPSIAFGESNIFQDINEAFMGDYTSMGVYMNDGDIYSVPNENGKNEVFVVDEDNGGNIELNRVSKGKKARVTNPEKIKEVLESKPIETKQESRLVPQEITINLLKGFFGVNENKQESINEEPANTEPVRTVEVSLDAAKGVLEKSENAERSSKDAGKSATRNVRAKNKKIGELSQELDNAAEEIRNVLAQQPFVKSELPNGDAETETVQPNESVDIRKPSKTAEVQNTGNKRNDSKNVVNVGDRISVIDQTGSRFKIADVIEINGNEVTVYNGKVRWTVAMKDITNPPQLQKNTSQMIASNIIGAITKAFPKIQVVYLNSEQFMEVFGGNYPGAYIKGTVYLNEDRHNDSTVVHEFGHVWSAYAKQANPALYKEAYDILIGSKYEAEVRRNYPELTNIDDIIDEAMAMAIQDNFFMQEESSGVIVMLKNWFNNLLDSISTFFGIESSISPNEKLRDFYKKISKELLVGFDYELDTNAQEEPKFQKYNQVFSGGSFYTNQAMADIGGVMTYSIGAMSMPISSQKTALIIEGIESGSLMSDIVSANNSIELFINSFGEILRDYVKEGGKNGLFEDQQTLKKFIGSFQYNMGYSRYFTNGLLSDNIVRDLVNEYNSGSDFKLNKDSHKVHRGIFGNANAQFIDPNTGKISQNIVLNISAELNQPIGNRPTIEAISRALSADSTLNFIDSSGAINEQFLDAMFEQFIANNGSPTPQTPFAKIWAKMKTNKFYKTWVDFDGENFLTENGVRVRFDSTAEMSENELNINRMNNPTTPIAKVVNFITNNGLFRLNNLNQKTFGMRMGGKLKIILDDIQYKWNNIASTVRVESEFFDSEINEMFHAKKLSTFGGRNNEFTVRKEIISATDPETGIESDYEIEAAKLISIYLTAKTQMASISGNTSILYDNNNQSMPLTANRGMSMELVKGQGNTKIILSPQQFAAIEAMMIPGGEYNSEYEAVKKYFNREWVFNIVNHVFKEINGVSLKAIIDPNTGERIYFPTFVEREFNQEAANQQRLSGVDEDSIYKPRSGFPESVVIKDPLSMMKQYREAVDDLISNGVVIKNLTMYASKMRGKWEKKGANWKNEVKFLEQRLETLRNYKELVYKDISRNILEDGGVYSKLMGNYARSVFAFNIGNPLKQMAGFFVSYGQGIVSNKNLSKSLPLLTKLTSASYAGFVQGEDNKRLSGIPTPELDLINEVESNEFAATLIYRILGKGGANTNGINFDNLRSTVQTGGLSGGSKVVAQGWNATVEAMDTYGLEAMQRSDRAVMLAFYNAAKLETIDEINAGMLVGPNGNLVTDINSETAKRRIVKLATDLTFATNQTSVLSDKTQVQLNRAPLVQAMIMFSSQQQKVMNLIIQNYYEWRDVGYNTNTPEWSRLKSSAITGTIFNSLFIAGVTGFISLLKAGFDDKEFEKQKEQFAWEVGRNMISSFPTVGSEILQSLTTMIDPARWENASGTSPVFDAVNQMSRGVGSSIKYFSTQDTKEQEKLVSDMIFNIPSGLAKMTGIPIFPVSVVVKNINKK